MSVARGLSFVCLCLYASQARAHAPRERLRATELEISAVPMETEIRVDGELVDARVPLHLSVGLHVIELRALGFASRIIPFDAREDERVALAVTLEPEATEPTAPVETELPADEPHVAVNPQPSLEAIAPMELATAPNIAVAPSPSWSSSDLTYAWQTPATCTTPEPVDHHSQRAWLWTGLALAASALALTLGFTLTSHHTSTLPPISNTPVAIRPGP